MYFDFVNDSINWHGVALPYCGIPCAKPWRKLSYCLPPDMAATIKVAVLPPSFFRARCPQAGLDIHHLMPMFNMLFILEVVFAFFFYTLEFAVHKCISIFFKLIYHMD